MLVTTAPSVPTLTTTSRTTSAVADPSATTAASASTTSSASETALAALAEVSLGNPETQDLATPAVSAPMTTVTATATSITSGAQILEAQILGANVLLLNGQVVSLSAPPALSTPMTTDITSVTPAATGPQLLGVNGMILTNAATSGAVPQAPTTAAISSVAIIGTQGEVIATTGGSSVTGGATGRNIPECMEAWDKATHITKTKWREVCARTLTEEHMY